MAEHRDLWRIEDCVRTVRSGTVKLSQESVVCSSNLVEGSERVVGEEKEA